jgi:hypothetical protein
MDLSVLSPCVFERPGGRAPNLVVIVHGCCTDANDVYLLRRNLGEAIKQVVLTKQPPGEPPEWEIVVWDWRKDEETGDDQTPKPITALPVPPAMEQEIEEFTATLLFQADIAYNAAAGDEGEGNKLKNAINQADINNQNKYKNNKHNYKHIHLIAHSAGSKLIDEAAKRLSKLNEKNAERPFIHLIFLDAYTPPFKGYDDKDIYGSLPGYPNHYSEHYVDRGLPLTMRFFKMHLILI